MVVQLIAKDKNEKLQFQGSCKLRIDSVSKILLVEPKIEEFKMISAMFKWKFVAEKNILFVFAEHDFQDFALIFDNSKICNKVFDCILKREAIRGDSQLILQRFLPPCFDEISKNNGTNSKFKEILLDFINKNGEKEEYIQILKDNNIFDLCYPEGVNNKRRNLRKRKAKDITNFDERDEENMVSDYSSSVISRESYSFISDRSSFKKRKYELNEKYKDDIIVNKSLYTFVTLNSRVNVTKNYLIIFITEENDFCYKFFYSNHLKCYQCSKCYSSKLKFKLSATIQNVGKENEIVYLKNKKHICEPLKYSDLLRASNRKIVMAPNYQLIKSIFGNKIIQRLAVFSNDEKSECFEYTWCESDKYFICYPCRRYHKIRVYVKIIKNDDAEEEYVELGRTEHKCKPIKFVPEEDFITASNRQIVMAPNFQLIKRKICGKIIQKMAVYTNDEKSECFEYTWHARNKCFVCTTCINHHKIHVYARKIKNDETKEEFVKLGPNEHKCKSIKFVPEDITVKIVKELHFKLWETVYGKKKVPKLTIFDSKNKKFGYVYSYKTSKKVYFCLECSKKKKFISAKLLQDENGQNYVEMGKAEHVCKLQKI